MRADDRFGLSAAITSEFGPNAGRRTRSLSSSSNAKQAAIAMLGHPFGARQMALKHPSRTTGVMFGIKMQHDACALAPVSTFRVRIEQTQIRDKMS
jgi:hypothetical protein